MKFLSSDVGIMFFTRNSICIRKGDTYSVEMPETKHGIVLPDSDFLCEARMLSTFEVEYFLG